MTTTTASKPPLPRAPGDVTPDWLTAALRSGGLDVTVRSFQRCPVGEGIGMMSGLERLDVEYAQGDGPAVVVLKMPVGNAANLAVAQSFHVYERELLFYRDVAAMTAAYTAKVFYADIDGHDFALLLEDLSAYELGDQIVGCTLEQARDGIAWLGRHHASLWGRVDEPVFDFLPLVSPSYSSEALMQGSAYGWDPMVAAFGAVLPDHIASLRDRYLAAAPKLFDWMATPPLTVIHGDFRMDNLFFARDEHQEPLIAIDWQGSLRGRATQDVAYFLSGSIPSDVRKVHERELVEEWRGHLVEGGVTGYSADDAWEDYRRATLYVWVIAVVIAGTLDPANERGRRWISVMLARSAAAFDDLGLIELLGQFERGEISV